MRIHSSVKGMGDLEMVPVGKERMVINTIIKEALVVLVGSVLGAFVSWSVSAGASELGYE